MIKDNQKLFNRLHVLLDAVIIVIAYVAAWYFRFKSGFFALSSWYISLTQYMKYLVLIVPVYLALYYLFQLYTPKRGTGKKIRSVAYFPGEYHRSACFYSLSLFGKTDGLFQKDAVCILLL